MFQFNIYFKKKKAIQKPPQEKIKSSSMLYNIFALYAYLHLKIIKSPIFFFLPDKYIYTLKISKCKSIIAFFFYMIVLKNAHYKFENTIWK